MHFRQIELAIDLSRTLSYRRTAENMFISQPALTHQIKKLEEEIGVALFSRSSRGVSLTPAGTIFCREMQKNVQSARETISVVRNCGGLFDDALRIGLNNRRMPQAYSEILRRFSGEYPSVLCDFRQGGRDRLGAFLQRDLDVVFYIGESIPDLDNIGRCELFASRLYCVMEPEHPLARRSLIRAKDLSNERVLFNDSAGPDVLLRAQQHMCKIASPILHLSHDTDTALLWIAGGRGVALMPGFCHDGSDRFAWVPYDWNETIPCCIAWHQDDHRPSLKAFVDIARAVFEETKTQPGCVL